MKSTFLKICTFLLFFSVLQLNAQQKHRCGFANLHENDLNKEAFLKHQEEFSRFLKSYRPNKTDTIIRVPIVFHIIYKNARENISDAQIQSQLDVLNADFGKMNPDTTNAQGFSIADVKIEFCLAKKAPDGSLSTGITRTPTTINNIGTTQQYYTVAPIWDRQKYLNLWVCDNNADTSDEIGFAYPPSISNSRNEGIVIDFIAFGTMGTAQAPNDKGRTATHEVGHMFDLLHIWGSRSFCGSSDFVDDTPEQQEEIYNCPNSHTSCGSADMLSNYMGYIDDRCMGAFTEGQKTRMRASIEMSRPGLASDDDCWPVGISEINALKGVSILPNPSNGSFRIKIPTSIHKEELTIDITNLAGQNIPYTSTIGSKEIEFSMNVPSGIYLMKLRTSKGQTIKKLIVQ